MALSMCCWEKEKRKKETFHMNLLCFWIYILFYVVNFLYLSFFFRLFSFKKLVTICKKEIVSISQPDLGFNHEKEIQGKVQTFYKDEEIASVVGNLLGSSNGLDRSRALHKYMKIGEKFYKESHQMDEQICGFESCIRRSYFHMKPLDDNQVENWHTYLDFVEKQEDFDWVILF